MGGGAEDAEYVEEREEEDVHGPEGDVSVSCEATGGAYKGAGGPGARMLCAEPRGYAGRYGRVRASVTWGCETELWPRDAEGSAWMPCATRVLSLGSEGEAQVKALPATGRCEADSTEAA